MSENTCEICEKSIPRYKCPVCFIKFCCVECYKSHKESGQCVKKEDKSDLKLVAKNGEVQNYEFETEDTVKPEKLNLLAFHKGVRHSLENRHLRDMLEYLDSAQDPA
ncbi:hypothetical protein X975_08217, partial [Stegodyphus mimosarum]